MGQFSHRPVLLTLRFETPPRGHLCSGAPWGSVGDEGLERGPVCMGEKRRAAPTIHVMLIQPRGRPPNGQFQRDA